MHERQIVGGHVAGASQLLQPCNDLVCGVALALPRVNLTQLSEMVGIVWR